MFNLLRGDFKTQPPVDRRLGLCSRPLFLHMVNLYLIIFEAWTWNEGVFYCFTICLKMNLDLEKNKSWLVNLHLTLFWQQLVNLVTNLFWKRGVLMVNLNLMILMKKWLRDLNCNASAGCLAQVLITANQCRPASSVATTLTESAQTSKEVVPITET